jgi:hypothetical protein
MEKQTQQVVESVTDSVQQKAMSILDWLEQSVKTTADFTAEQIPLFIQELLVYNFWYSLIHFVFGVIGIVFAILMIKQIVFNDYLDIKEHEKDKRGYSKDSAVVKRILFVAMTVVFVIGGSVKTMNNTEWFKIKVAPRVYLMEYVTTQLKK